MATDEHTRHVVLLSFRADSPQARIREIEAAFAALEHLVPGIVDLEWGTNESPEGLDQGFTHGFLVTFEDAAARDAYLTHPVHLAFGESLRPDLDRILVVDYVPRGGRGRSSIVALRGEDGAGVGT